MKNPRPTTRDKAIIERAVVKHIMPRIVKWLKGEYDPEEHLVLVDQVVCSYYDNIWSGNGFDVARELDDCGFKADAKLVQILEDGFSYIDDTQAEAEKEWLARNNINPRFAVGDSVTFDYYNEDTASHSRHTGTVCDITVDGYYCICCRELGHKTREELQGKSGTLGTLQPWEIVEKLNPKASGQ